MFRADQLCSTTEQAKRIGLDRYLRIYIYNYDQRIYDEEIEAKILVEY